MGNLVDLGRAPHIHLRPLAHVHCISFDSHSGGRPPAPFRSLRRLRHLRVRRRPARLDVHPLVANAASPARNRRRRRFQSRSNHVEGPPLYLGRRHAPLRSDDAPALSPRGRPPRISAIAPGSRRPDRRLHPRRPERAMTAASPSLVTPLSVSPLSAPRSPCLRALRVMFCFSV